MPAESACRGFRALLRWKKGLATPTRHTGGVTCRVAFVEDDALLRLSLSDALSHRGDVDLVSSSSGGREALELAKRREVDVVLLDVHLGVGPSGIDLATALRQASPGIGIIFLSSVKDPRLLGVQPAALPRGARYLLKTEVDDLDALVSLIHEVQGDVFDAGSGLPSLPFSRTQIDILRLVAAGHSNEAIAAERFVTKRAVEAAVSRLAKHLGLHETPGVNQRVHIAATFFREMGWTP